MTLATLNFSQDAAQEPHCLMHWRLVHVLARALQDMYNGFRSAGLDQRIQTVLAVEFSQSTSCSAQRARAQTQTMLEICQLQVLSWSQRARAQMLEICKRYTGSRGTA